MERALKKYGTYDRANVAKFIYRNTYREIYIYVYSYMYVCTHVCEYGIGKRYITIRMDLRPTCEEMPFKISLATVCSWSRRGL